MSNRTPLSVASDQSRRSHIGNWPDPMGRAIGSWPNHNAPSSLPSGS